MNPLFYTLFLPALGLNVILRMVQFILDRTAINYIPGGTWKSKISNALIILILSSGFLLYYLFRFNGTLDIIILMYLAVSITTTGIHLFMDVDVIAQWFKDWNFVISLILTFVLYSLWYGLIVLRYAG